MTRFIAHLIVLAFVLVVSGSRPTPPSILKTDILLQLDLATKLSQCSDDERWSLFSLYKDSWRSTPQWGLQSPPNIHEHTYPKENIVIDTKIVEIRKPQAELAETMCLCWHLPHLLQHRHMVTPPRAFVRFLTLPNYLSVTSLNCIITRSSFPHLFKHQRRSSSRPELIERVLCCTLLCCTLLY